MRHVARYTARHIRRSMAKSLLSCGLAVLLAGTIGQFTVIRGMYGDIYDNLVITAYYLNGVTFPNAMDVGGSDYVASVYYENTLQSVESHREHITVTMTNNIDRYSKGEAVIEFYEGYDYSSFSKVTTSFRPDKSFNFIALESGFMDRNGISLGDSIRLDDPSLWEVIRSDKFGMLPPAEDDVETWAMQWAYVDQALDKLSLWCTVAGEVTSGIAKDTAFIPVTRGFVPIFQQADLALDYVEYILASPHDADEFRALAESKVIGNVGSIGSAFVMDTSEADSIFRTLNLLNVLYPIAVVAAAIMSGLFPGLIVMQSDREASIMRALGTTKKRARAMLILEQALLCLAGLLCAAALLLVINGGMLVSYSRSLALYAALHFAACAAGAAICAIVVTRKHVLELLQVKE